MAINIMVSGTHGVGKTQLIERLLRRKLCSVDETYIDPKLTETMHQFGDSKYHVFLFENSGQNQFVCSSLVSTGKMRSAILLVNLDDQSCIDSLTNQLIDFRSYNLKTFVIGTWRAFGKRLRSKSQMIAHCRGYNCSYFEVDPCDERGFQ